MIGDSRADDAIKAMTAAARTGKIGDGKIFVFSINDAVRIRNGDREDNVL